MKREINIIKNSYSDEQKSKNKPAHMQSDGRIATDPDGSWTGAPLNEDEVPVQDVDDL